MAAPLLVPTEDEKVVIEPILESFDKGFYWLKRFYDTLKITLESSEELKPLIHTIRHRIKDRTHLQDKLVRKLRECGLENKPFDITPANLHMTINDLAGFRILHLHTVQAKAIHDHLDKLLRVDAGYKILEGPEARTWDIEYEARFREMGFATKRSPRLYTSIHYVIYDRVPALEMTCELQVRTLTEETWGEIDHTINYPHPTKHVALREQIRVLARATSTAGRLADSIFATLADAESKSSLKGSEGLLNTSEEKMVSIAPAEVETEAASAKASLASSRKAAHTAKRKKIIPKKSRRGSRKK